MDLERSFGPAYARGSLVKGQQAWAVIAVNVAESQAIVDGILTLGVLWLAHCRENAGGRRMYRGLRAIVPRGMATLTTARLAWMNPDAAQVLRSIRSSVRRYGRVGTEGRDRLRQRDDAAGASPG